MKYVNLILAVILLAVVGIDAAQVTTLDGMAEVRNPVRLKSWLETNAADAQSRIAALEGGSTVGEVLPGYIIVGSATSNGVDVAVSGDITMATNGAVAIAAGVIVDADVATNAALTSAKMATAVQTSLGKADTALQPNAVNRTNSFVDIAGLTNTIIVLQGRVTSWTVTE